tara:strand:+ start:1229 stop:2032 length:804 start_codon:yes stop_codon:yes gene_type:complete
MRQEEQQEDNLVFESTIVGYSLVFSGTKGLMTLFLLMSPFFALVFVASDLLLLTTKFIPINENPYGIFGHPRVIEKLQEVLLLFFSAPVLAASYRFVSQGIMIPRFYLGELFKIATLKVFLWTFFIRTIAALPALLMVTFFSEGLQKVLQPHVAAGFFFVTEKYIALSLCFVLPAIAIGRPPSFLVSLRETSGNFLTLLSIFLLTTIPFWGLSAAGPLLKEGIFADNYELSLAMRTLLKLIALYLSLAPLGAITHLYRALVLEHRNT